MERRLSRPLLISAIVPIAGFPNGTQQIESWTSALELRDFEVILVVDSEELKTKAQVKILADRLRKITKVSVLESHCRNPGGSRNLGLSIASGSWITFWDCDDIPNPSRFVEMVIEAETCGKDIAIGEFTIQNGVRHRLKPHKSTDPSKIFESVAVNPGLWRFAIKSDIAKLLRFPDLRMAEDQVYLYELFQESQNISIYPKSVYEYWSYQSGQLTKDIDAISDLNAAIEFFHKKFRINRSVPTLIVAMRLIFSAIKRADSQTKWRSLFRLVLISTSFPKAIILSVQTVRIIWKTK